MIDYFGKVSKRKTPKIYHFRGFSFLHQFGGAEGVRTLVQLCDKLCLLHAYFPLYFREQPGRKPTLTFSLGTLSRHRIVPYNSQHCYFDAPDSNLTMQQSEGQKLSNSKLGS